MALVKTDIARLVRVANPDLSQAEASASVDIIIAAIRDTLLAGGKVELRGFAVIEPRHKKSGKARNIRTGEEVPIPGGLSVKFRPGKSLRNA
jgi:nucleoid DNA-binding protein